MKKLYLEKSLAKYICFEVDEEIAKTSVDNFENLLNYIGTNIDYGKDYYAGNAYLAIRKKTDEILGIQNFKISKLRTSKQEVKSIRQCFKRKFIRRNKYIMKIPFKVSFIFEAIILLVSDINKEKPVPQNLLPLIGLSYGIAFYKKYIDEYMEHLDEIKDDYNNDPDNPTLKCRIELQNDFNSLSSPFAIRFQRREVS